jgi:hypothetical protein
MIATLPTGTPGTATAWTEYVDSLNWNPGLTKNDQTFSAALRAASLGVEREAAHALIADKIINSGGDYLEDKVDRQIERAYEHVLGEADGVPRPPRPKYEFQPDKLQAVAAKSPGLDERWLAVRSPDRVVSTSSRDFLARLFLPGEAVIVFDQFESQGQAVWRNMPDKDWLPLPTGGPDGVWFLIQPVDGHYHPNPRERGKQSRRSQESVTAWRYLLLECDHEKTYPGVNALWLAALVQMPLPIVAIYTSGGKSIHALVRVDAGSKQEWDAIRDKLLPIVIPLGADRQAMSAVRLSRLPKCARGAEMQRLLFLNPGADGTPISEMRVCRRELTLEDYRLGLDRPRRQGGRP